MEREQAACLRRGQEDQDWDFLLSAEMCHVHWQVRQDRSRKLRHGKLQSGI
jgi:hypothetical protein